MELKNITQIINKLIETIGLRDRDILRRRFALGKYKQPQTLQAIGMHYGLTRERVRQIQIICMQNLRKGQNKDLALPVANKLKLIFSQRNKIIAQQDLFSMFPKNILNYVLFFLNFDENFWFFNESQLFKPLWASDRFAVRNAKQILLPFIKELKITKKPIPKKRIEKKVPFDYIKVCKLVGYNPFDEFGLMSWPEINPSGARDKAYTILSRQSKPLHYTDIARLIKKIYNDSRIPAVSTVHNELIKDTRFVLKGNGIYYIK